MRRRKQVADGGGDVGEFIYSAQYITKERAELNINLNWEKLINLKT